MSEEEVQEIMKRVEAGSGRLQNTLMANLTKLREAGIIFSECSCCNQLQHKKLGEEPITKDEQTLIDAVYSMVTERYANYAIDFRAVVDMDRQSVSYTFDVNEAKLRSLVFGEV